MKKIAKTVKNWTSLHNVLAKSPRLLIEWECGKCGEKNASTVCIYDVEGGCQGHPEGNYCYCPPRQFLVDSDCLVCGVENEVRTS